MNSMFKQKLPLAALVGWCLALLAARTWYARNMTYWFMAWNLFLALVPVVAASVLHVASRHRRWFALKAIAFCVWLVFMPNAPYLVTDFIHLANRPPVPLWFDIALFGSYAATGLLLGYSAVADVEAVVVARFGRIAGMLVAAGSLLLCGFGIYLGRILRWNSWDIVTTPLPLAREIADRALNPSAHPAAWGASAIYGVGLVLGYLAIRGVAGALGHQHVAAAQPKPLRRREGSSHTDSARRTG